MHARHRRVAALLALVMSAFVMAGGVAARRASPTASEDARRLQPPASSDDDTISILGPDLRPSGHAAVAGRGSRDHRRGLQRQPDRRGDHRPERHLRDRPAGLRDREPRQDLRGQARRGHAAGRCCPWRRRPRLRQRVLVELTRKVLPRFSIAEPSKVAGRWWPRRSGCRWSLDPRRATAACPDGRRCGRGPRSGRRRWVRGGCRRPGPPMPPVEARPWPRHRRSATRSAQARPALRVVCGGRAWDSCRLGLHLCRRGPGATRAPAPVTSVTPKWLHHRTNWAE